MLLSATVKIHGCGLSLAGPNCKKSGHMTITFSLAIGEALTYGLPFFGPSYCKEKFGSHRVPLFERWGSDKGQPHAWNT